MLFISPLTSDIEVGRGGVACPVAVGGHALVLALVGLLAHLYLQGACMKEGAEDRERKTAREKEPSHTSGRHQIIGHNP